MDTGTGVVHTAPSHGQEDFATGVKYGLDATSMWMSGEFCAMGCRSTRAESLGCESRHHRVAEKTRRAAGFGKV